MTTTRHLRPHEQQVLHMLLEGIPFPGSAELIAQIPLTRVAGGLPTFLDLTVDASALRADREDGPIPVRAFVEGDDGAIEGELLVWVRGGYLSALELAWVTDAMPQDLPAPDRIRVHRSVDPDPER